jgi:dihydrofolate synthase/folylpolyglutamate synthase
VSMNYKETIDYMYAQLPMFHREGKVAYKANLNNIIQFANLLGNPQDKYKTIHVAGTNGKGSVSHMLASVLHHAGYKTGLYTSPHLIDFRERIKVNGRMVDEAFVISFVEHCQDIISKNEPSFFEMTTAMAFSYFEQEKVDIAIIETGLGGRLDATNIIIPILSVITNISFDHTDILGNTLALIAAEKAGIIKMNTPLVVGEFNSDTKPVFELKAREMNSLITFAQERYLSEIVESKSISEQKIKVTNQISKTTEIFRLDLLGNYQQKNINTTLCAIDFAIMQGIAIDSDAIKTGIATASATTGLLGRWQILGNEPLIIADTGHNEDGIKQTIAQLKEQSYERLHIVFGMVNDKDISKVLACLPTDAMYYFTKANLPRAMNEDLLMAEANKFSIKGNSFSTVKLAFEAAQENANQGDIIYVGGSTFIVAEALSV